MNRTKRRGFSLIELVIVILILGIIAAVAAPRLFNQAADASENATRQQLAILRNAIELARASDPNVEYPGTNELEDALRPLLNGPFPAPQIGSVSGDTAVHYDANTDPTVPVASDPTATTAGWAYKPANGELRLNVPNSELGADW